MKDFDFASEMVMGKKHMKKLEYNVNDYKFIEILKKLFTKLNITELNESHTKANNEYELFTMLGKDSNTEFHDIFYNELHDGWKEMKNEYEKFVKEVVLPFLELDEALVQTFPSFRVHLPNNVAIVINHYDSDENHKHPTGEINFIYAFTEMFDTNTVYVEKMPLLDEYNPILLKEGETICFNGNKCKHHNKVNDTGKTRISWDFRILPLNYYNPENSLESVTTNTKYVDGGYYTRYIANTPDKIYKEAINWDKEKENFNGIMKKYNVNDAWGVVDIFEKRIAEYAGSKYAISVDCCTDALFLCLKYLKASGTITLPARTWISVPCTVIHTGCKIQFEDIEWSGAYQLKPYPIYDGAVRMKKGMFKPGTFHCLSFHIRKHVPIGKGGMILTDDKDAYDWFRTVRYEGRTMGPDGINYLLYKEDPIDSMGWNMYMTPEQAARGLELFEKLGDDNPDQESSGTCKDLSKLEIYGDMKITNEITYYSYDYWFNNQEHDSWDQGGENYYVNTFYEKIVMELDDIPKEGYILILGTHNCHSFDKLCRYFGYGRCIGYDLHNPNNHPNVIIKDCMELGDEDKIDIAFCHNDLGNYATTPKLKEHAQKWAAKNMVKGGYFLSNNNFNRAKVDNIEIMEENGFEVKQLINLQESFDISNLPFQRIEGYMLSKKI